MKTASFACRCWQLFRPQATLSLLSFALAVFSSSAQNADYRYTTNNDTITITGYVGPGGEVTIPATIDSLPVTAIASDAFNGVIDLTNVTVPDSVTNLGSYCFAWCIQLTNIAIGNGVTQVGNEAFLNCISLAAITVAGSNPSYSSVDGVFLDKEQTTLIKYPGGKAGSYTILDTVTNIAVRAFSECAGLTRVTMPKSVISIGETAFASCTSLADITIGEGVSYLGVTPFVGCTSLMTITVEPANPNFSSLSGVLFNKDQTTLLLYPEGKAGSYTIPDTVTTIGDWAFYSCTSLTGVTIPNSVRNTKISAFDHCTGLTSLVIPDSVTNLAFQAFLWCTSLTDVTIGESVVNIDMTAFGNCSSLRKVETPDSVITINSAAFLNCTSLTNLTLGKGLSNIEGGIFSRCPALTAITVDAANATYSSIAGVLFDKSQTILIQCPAGKARSYTVPDSVTSVGDWAFYYCTSLTNVTIPNSVTKIGTAAFSSCTHLTNVTIPNSVTSIGDSAFSDCTGLTSVTIGNSVTSIGDVAFGYCDSLTSVTIPDTVTSVGNLAFYYCTSLTSVTIPNSVNSINDYAFYSCTSLAEVYFNGNAPRGSENVFGVDDNATLYYLPGTTGWGPAFGGRPTALWVLPNPMILNYGPSFSLQTNAFGFIISWATNVPVVVEACTNLASPIWSPLSTNNLTGGWSYFSDPQWTNYPARFYRLRSP